MLFKKGLHPVIICFIYDSYCRQQLTVKWNDTVSDYINVQNGVKQGNVFLPILHGLVNITFEK